MKRIDSFSPDYIPIRKVKRYRNLLHRSSLYPALPFWGVICDSWNPAARNLVYYSNTALQRKLHSVAYGLRIQTLAVGVQIIGANTWQLAGPFHQLVKICVLFLKDTSARLDLSTSRRVLTVAVQRLIDRRSEAQVAGRQSLNLFRLPNERSSGVLCGQRQRREDLFVIPTGSCDSFQVFNFVNRVAH